MQGEADHTSLLFHEFDIHGKLAFALPQAVNLAEMGETLRDKQLGMVLIILGSWICLNNKQIGFVFCTEVMPPNHELQLMLVNTIRKVNVLVVMQVLF